MDRQEKEVLKKILGTRVASFTNHNKTYLVFLDETGYTCNCPDFIFRKGSYELEWTEDGETKRQQGCKHIAEYLGETYGLCKAKDRYGFVDHYPRRR